MMFLVMALILASAQNEDSPVSKEDVIRLTRKRVGDDLIAWYLVARGARFQLTPADVEQLRREGVSPSVISIMQGVVPPDPRERPVQSLGTGGFLIVGTAGVFAAPPPRFPTLLHHHAIRSQPTPHFFHGTTLGHFAIQIR